MTTLSTHVLDIEQGIPAIGVGVRLLRHQRELATAHTNSDGRVPHLATLEAGVYTLEFDAADYFARKDNARPFLRRVSIEFEIAAGAAHYHVPLLLSPYACTSYRGS